MNVTRASSVCLLFAVLSFGGSCEPSATRGNGNPPTTPPPTPTAPVGAAGMTHRLALGMNHGCAVARAGTVWCWGANGHGELADGTTTPTGWPVRVNGLEGAVEVAAGDTHSCARRGDGEVACWGYNLYGQSGDGTTPPEMAPEVDVRTAKLVPGLDRVASLTGGMHTFCARLEDGNVKCWGNGEYFLIGERPVQKLARPTLVQALRGVVDMSAMTEACARLGPPSKNVWCWGRAQNDRPRARPGTEGAKQVVVGLGHQCVVTGEGRVACWGHNGSGELGLPDAGEIGDRDPLRPVPGLADVSQVAAGRNSTCALVAGGKVSCWGATSALGCVPPNLRETHNVGHGGSAAQWQYVDHPVEVPGVEGLDEIAGSPFGMCGLRGDNVICWREAVDAPMTLGAPPPPTAPTPGTP